MYVRIEPSILLITTSELCILLLFSERMWGITQNENIILVGSQYNLSLLCIFDHCVDMRPESSQFEMTQDKRFPHIY